MPCSLCDVYIISHSQPEHDKRVYKNMIQSVETLATALKKVFDLLNICIGNSMLITLRLRSEDMDDSPSFYY